MEKPRSEKKHPYPNENADLSYIQELESAFEDRIKKFSTYIGSITYDLEQKEIAHNKKRIKAGRNPKKLKWDGSTMKIDLVKSLMFEMFPIPRLLKYNVILLLPMKKWIDARHEDFFLKAQVFPGAPEEDIVFFRNLWAIEGTMTPNEKDVIWKYWDTQIGIVEDWQKETGWEVNDNEDLEIPDIDYEEEARKAGIDIP